MITCSFIIYIKGTKNDTASTKQLRTPLASKTNRALIHTNVAPFGETDFGMADMTAVED